VLLLAGLAACQAAPPQPAALDTRSETCARCRMAVSDARYASQLVTPGEEPRFFDDLACLGAFVRSGGRAAGAVAFVADHRTREWVRAEAAVYTRVPGLSTPMGSSLVAHADARSREADPAAAGGSAVAAADVVGPAGSSAGSRP
jgi:copper chaperone NosL